MNESLIYQIASNEDFSENLDGKIQSTGILADVTLTFEENLIVDEQGGCQPYGCSCISYEKCCGCLIQ